MSDSNRSLQWGHLNVNVSDLEASIAFYARLGFELFMPGIPYLGLERERMRELAPQLAAALGVPEGTRGRAVILQLDEGFPKLDLTEFDVPHPGPPPGNGDLGAVRLCLATADLDGLRTDLEAASVEFVAATQAGVGGLADVALCRDPDGTLIELIRIFPERWAALAAGD